MAKKIVLAGACRTAIGSMGGALSTTPAPELGSIVIKEALNRAGVAPEQVDHVYMGCVIQAGLGQNVARQASLKAGLPVETPAVTVNVVCGSGLNCVNMAAQMIQAGDADIVVAGGMENMSMAPYALKNARYGYRMGNAPMIDTMVNDALWDAFNDYHMGITAENVAEQWGLTREQLDEFAAASQQKACAAIEAGKFKDEIVPVEVKIFAGEQKAQCLDYYQFARQRDQTAKVVYLTRFGTMPGAYSYKSGEECVPEKDIICISFQNTILQWLIACCQVSRGRTKMVLEQLRESVEHMTGATEEKTMQAVAKEIGKSADSLRAAIQISDSLKNAKTKLLLQVMEEFKRQMAPLKETYHLEEETQIDWYGYEKQVDQFYDHAYSTYPGINYIVTNIPAFRTYQLWFRIEIDNRLFAGFCLFDPTANSPEGKGNQVDDYDTDTRTWIERILKVSKSDQSAWWAVWRYLPTGSTQSSKEVPDFRAMNDAAVSLADEKVRKIFVANAIRQIEQTLLNLLK